MQRSHLWVFALALGFVILWCVSIGMTVKASSTEAAPSSAQTAVAQAAAATSVAVRSANIVEDKLGFEMIGIAGWCLVGIGFFGVAVTAALGTKPKKRRRPVRMGMPRNPSKVINTVYSPESRKYSRRIERRR